jgi:hypothetical protein
VLRVMVGIEHDVLRVMVWSEKDVLWLMAGGNGIREISSYVNKGKLAPVPSVCLSHFCRSKIALISLTCTAGAAIFAC